MYKTSKNEQGYLSVKLQKAAGTLVVNVWITFVTFSFLNFLVPQRSVLFVSGFCINTSVLFLI